MKVGPLHWQCVTTDSTGVPLGGRYGNVKWFEAQAAKYGLKVAWSRRYAAFGIYTINHGTKYVWQITLRKWGGNGWGAPVPMTSTLLSCLVKIREMDARYTGSIMDAIALKEAHQKDEVRKEWEQADEDIRSEVLRRTALITGAATPNIMVLPNRIGLYKPFRQRRRKLRLDRKHPAGRIIVP